MRESVAAPRRLLASSGWALLALAGLGGCSGSTMFECEESSQCSLAGQFGTCEPNGACSFPDASCPSGQRYGEHAPLGVAGSCVPAQDPTDGSATTGGGTGVIDGSGTGSASTGSPLDDAGTTVVSMTTLDASEGTTTTTTTTTTTSSSSSTSTAGASTEGTSTGSPTTVLGYPAALAECNDPITLDPDACELGGNPAMGAMVVDSLDAGIGPMHGLLRFDLDDAIDPDLVVSVTLRLVATDPTVSQFSGEVYRVEPFGLMDLFSVQPATVGPMLAPDQGPVAGGDVVEWVLPPDVLLLGEPSLYLGILPLSTDGVDYWNLDGAQPPELIVEQQP